MSTNILKSSFETVDVKSISSKADLSSLYVDGKALNEIYIKVGKEAKLRKVRSIEEFLKHYKAGKIFDKDGHSIDASKKIESKKVNVPTNHDSISLNKPGLEAVPYGLKRNFSIEEASSETPDNEKYYLVQVDKKQEFYKPSEIYFYNSTNKKILISEYTGDFSRLKNLVLYAPTGKAIETIYTEKMFVLTTQNAKEEFDLNAGLKKTYSISEEKSEDGKTEIKVTESSEKIDPYFSEQKFVKKTVPDEKKPGKTKDVSLVEVKNFEVQPDGEYISLRIDGTRKMVKLSQLVDENSQPITDIRNMLGKKVLVKEGDKVIGASSTLTYEQVNMLYSTIKTYQPTDKKAGENTYIRLKETGEYINELGSAQPKAYKVQNLANNNFDAYLVKVVSAEGTKFVVVSKDYFAKHGDTTLYKRSNAVRISRCDVNDPQCSVIQTTSKGEQIEQCSVVKKIKFAENESIAENAKETAVDEFKHEYEQDAYLMDDIFHNGQVKKVETGKRFEYTDVTYSTDYADDLIQYRGMNVKGLQIKNGKMVGGAKFNVGKGIVESYKKWGKALAYGYGATALAGIFIPVVGPIVAAAYTVGMVAAIPGIPIANAVIGMVKNSKAKKFESSKFKDKAKYNQQKAEKEIEKEIKMLYRRMTDKNYVPFPEARFDEECNAIINKIVGLSNATLDDGLVVVNGQANVTKENANAANAYLKEYNGVSSALNAAAKDFNAAKEKFEEIDAKMQKKYASIGKKVPKAFQDKYDKIKKAYDSAKAKHQSLVAKKADLENYTKAPTAVLAHEERDRLIGVTKMLKLFVHVKNFPDSELTEGLTDQEKELMDTLKFDLRDGIFLDGIGLGTKDEEFVFNHHFADDKLVNEEGVVFEDVQRKGLFGKKVKAGSVGSESVKITDLTYKQKEEVKVVDGEEQKVEYYKEKWLNVKHAIQRLNDKVNKKKDFAPKIEEPAVLKDEEEKKTGTGKEVKQTKVAATKLSKTNLENLLKNIEILKMYDDIYAGADEEIPEDIEMKISKLEELIKPDLHLLQSAAKNKKYDGYLKRVQDAAHIVQTHQSPHNRKLGSLNM